MDNKVNIKEKKPPKKLYTILSIILLALLSIGLFYGTYHFMLNKSTGPYESSMKQYVKEIIDENKKVGAYNKNQSIDTENTDDIKKGLDSNISKLTSIKSSIEKLTPAEKHKSSHDSLIKGLNNNILAYRQIASMLQNPSSKDISSSLSSLENYRKEIFNNYQLISAKDLKISFPTESETFINNSINYFTETARINKDLEIQNAQSLEFIQKMDDINAKFVLLKTDFSYQLGKVRTGSGNYDDILTTINQYRDKYLTLKKDFTTINVPQKSLKIYNNFNSILDDYNLYLQEIKFSVSNEKTKSNGTQLDEETINSLYSVSKGKFLTLDNNYTNFLKSYSEFKENNIK